MTAKFSDMLTNAVSSVISDDIFQIASPLARDALDTAVAVSNFIPTS